MQDAVQPTGRSRQSNWELLRIVAMLMIVAGHMAQQGGIYWGIGQWDLLLVMAAGSGLRIGVNLFLMIGTWFMTDADFQASRILRLYGETAFYAVGLTLLMALLGVNAPRADMLRVLMPFLGRPLWFASAYISLIALSPFLKKVLAWEQDQLRKLVWLLFVLLCLVSTVPIYKESYVADFCWCVYLYLFIGYGKRSGKWERKNKSKFLFLAAGLAIYFLLVFVRWICAVCPAESVILSAGRSLTDQYISDIRSLPNFLCGFFVFVFFLNMDIGSNRIVNEVAKTAFGVYAIHAVPAFSDFLWYRIYRCDVWKNSKYVSLYFIAAVLSVYFFASVIDRLRMKWIEPIWQKSRVFQFLCRKIEKFYQGIDERV